DDRGTRPGDHPHSHRADGAGPADLCGGPGMSAREGTMLDVAGLSVSFPAGPVLQGVDLQLQAGRCLAIVGESGAGKSVLARTVVGLAGEGGAPARVVAERLQVAGRDMRGASRRRWRSLRGRHVGFVL